MGHQNAEEFLEEEELFAEGVVGEVVVGEVPLQLQNVPLEIQVGQQEAPESPSPSPSSPSPVFQHSARDASSFMGFYTLDDLKDLKQWENHIETCERRRAFGWGCPKSQITWKVFIKHM